MSEAEQLPLDVQRTARPSRRKRPLTVEELAASRPIARVRIDSQVPHLDHDFDYAVPEALDATAVVGARVRVRFSGRLVDGFIVGRGETAEVSGELRRLERVIGVEPVLTTQTLALVEAVAERYAGTFSDVVRAAVPPRHARAEGRSVEPCDWVAQAPGLGTWGGYAHGEALLERIAEPPAEDEAVRAVRAAWSIAPARRWQVEILDLALAVLARPRGGVLVVVPDAADVASMVAACRAVVPAEAIASLTADSGPERRYGQFLRILRGGARLVIGTRASVFAPVADLSLIVLWDDGDQSHCDPQAPYWDARDVAALRSHLTGCHLVVGSPARSVATQQWCASGWARSIVASRATVNSQAPRVSGVLDSDVARDEAAAVARMPHRAWEAARTALKTGPVLISVGRRGYVPALSCQGCRTPARCGCGGPLQLTIGGAVPSCAWCGALASNWTCEACGGRRLRAGSIGSERTAEEVGRAFPGVPVISSHGGHRVESVPGEPAVVIATSGMEPDCEGGYSAVIVLDARSALQRVGLDAEEEAVRRWFGAARLAAPKAPVVIAADNGLPAVQAVVRWNAAGWAQRELEQRANAGLPPAVRMAALTGEPDAIVDLAGSVGVEHRLLGPVPAADRHHPTWQRGLIAVGREHGPALGRELRAITATRSARGKAHNSVVHVHLDPRDI